MHILRYNANILPETTHYGFVSYKEPWIHFKRLTDEYMLYFVKSGELYIDEAGKKYSLKKGDYIILQPGLLHQGFKKARCDYFYFHFKHSDISNVDTPLQTLFDEISQNRSQTLKQNIFQENSKPSAECYLPKQYNISNDKTLTYLLYMLNEAAYDYGRKNEYYKSLASCKLMELMVRISREFSEVYDHSSNSSYPEAYVKCQAVIDYLNNEYHKKIDSSEIQERFGLSYAYLNRVFKKMTGYTIINYINMVRIKKAVELIESTDICLSEVGYLVGIDDPYYFSKTFKKYMGRSPMHFRNKNKQK